MPDQPIQYRHDNLTPEQIRVFEHAYIMQQRTRLAEAELEVIRGLRDEAIVEAVEVLPYTRRAFAGRIGLTAGRLQQIVTRILKQRVEDPHYPMWLPQLQFHVESLREHQARDPILNRDG